MYYWMNYRYLTGEILVKIVLHDLLNIQLKNFIHIYINIFIT